MTGCSATSTWSAPASCERVKATLSPASAGSFHSASSTRALCASRGHVALPPVLLTAQRCGCQWQALNLRHPTLSASPRCTPPPTPAAALPMAPDSAISEALGPAATAASRSRTSSGMRLLSFPPTSKPHRCQCQKEGFGAGQASQGRFQHSNRQPCRCRRSEARCSR